MSDFSLTKDEMELLADNIRPEHTAWEWGTGKTTVLLTQICRRVTSVEHQATHAAEAIIWARERARQNLSVIYAPPDLPYVEGTIDDGDLATFRRYVEGYSGRGVDVVLIDGRARVECARWVAERAPFGPHPDMAIFLHDAERPQYAEVFEILREEARVGRLALLRAR